MATIVDVVVTGIITFLAGSTLDVSPAGNMHAAIAIEDNARPNVNKVTRFGMALAIHQTTLSMLAVAVDSVSGEKPARFVLDGNMKTITLEGDRIQIGEFVSNTCTPFAVTGAAPKTLFEKVPHLSRIVSDIEMAPNTLPLNGNYGNISKAKISAWLDIHDGAVTAEVTPSTRPEAEFRPSGHKQQIATSATWQFVVVGNPACITITPFGLTKPDVVVKLNETNIKASFTNVAPTTGAAGMAAQANADALHPGITYDWELFYDILKTPPCLPPLPYVRIKPIILGGGLHDHANSDTGGDELTGINCGPLQRP
jgi:hypothetical protein